MRAVLIKLFIPIVAQIIVLQIQPSAPGRMIKAERYKCPVPGQPCLVYRYCSRLRSHLASGYIPGLRPIAGGTPNTIKNDF